MKKARLKVVKVSSFADVKPKQLDGMTLKDLKATCDKWDIQVSGNKEELTKQFSSLFMGIPIARKGCTCQFIILEKGSDKSSLPVSDGMNMTKFASEMWCRALVLCLQHQISPAEVAY